MLFETVVLASMANGAATIAKEAAAVVFVHDAFSYLKVTGQSGAAKALMDKAGVVTDGGVVELGKDKSAAFLPRAASGRIWEREPSGRTVF